MGPDHQAPPAFERLRSGLARVAYQPSLVAGLREWLEDGLVETVRAAEAGGKVPVVLDRPGPAAPDEVRAALAGAAFRLAVTTGTLDGDGGDVLEVFGADPRWGAARRRASVLSPATRAALTAEVGARSEVLARDWGGLPPSWLPRTSVRAALPLAGGRILLTGTADLVLGRPSTGVASTCVVMVGPTAPDRLVTDRLALLETLRTGAPPFATAGYGVLDGALRVDAVSRSVLVRAVHDVLEQAEGTRNGSGTDGRVAPAAAPPARHRPAPAAPVLSVAA